MIDGKAKRIYRDQDAPVSQELQTTVQDKKTLILRSAYREGQRDMLMKIKSIIKASCIGDGDRTVREIEQYCDDYSCEAALDKHITDNLLKELPHG